MIFIPGMHFRSLSALSFVQLWGKWIRCSCSILMIHGVHLLTWAEASIYLSHVIKSCQGPGGGLSSWGTESRDMGHPVSYDHHTLGPTCGSLIGWSHQHRVLIGRWQPLRKGMEQTQTQGITRNTTNIVNSRQWRGDPGDYTQLWWQCGTQTSCEVSQWPRGNCKQLQELQSHFQTQVFWCEKGDWLYTFNERWTNSAIDFATSRHVTVYRNVCFNGITPQLSAGLLVWVEVCIFHHPRTKIIWIFMVGWRGDVGWTRRILCLVLITPSSHPIIYHTHGAPRVTASLAVITFSKYKMQPDHEYKEASDIIMTRSGHSFYMTTRIYPWRRIWHQTWTRNMGPVSMQTGAKWPCYICITSGSGHEPRQFLPRPCSPSLGRLLPSPSHLIKQSEPKIIDMILHEASTKQLNT